MGDRKGFTLLELVIAGTIVGILAIVASSNLFLWLDHAAVVDFRQELLSRCGDARTRAMASNLQHRMVVDLGNETVALQRWNAATASWTSFGNRLDGTRGAGIQDIIYDTTTAAAATFSFIFNPGGQVLTQDNTGTTAPVNEARIRLTSNNAGERATIRIFGFTSKARLENVPW